MYLPAPRPSPLRPVNGPGVVSFALGLMVTFGLIVYAAWMAIAAVTVASATQQGATQQGATQQGANQQGATQQGATQHEAGRPGATADIATTPPVAAPPVTPTPSGATMAFDQLWIARDGNTIAAGTPTLGVSAHEGRSVIRVAVTLTNNGEQPWNPAATTFIGTVNGGPAPEAAEGDWMYSVPIVGQTSVTLTKVFVGGPGQFNLTVSTPNGVALFSGQI